MCLLKTHWLPKIAKEDIVCYKKLYIYPTFNLYISPILDEKYIFDDDNKCIKTAKFKLHEILFGLSIGRGIHSYRYKRISRFNSIVYLKSYIPKGTRYYESIDDEYVSEKLIVCNKKKYEKSNSL